MLDIYTTLICVSATAVAVVALVVLASLIACIVTLAKNLPRGIRAVRAATESSLLALEVYSKSVAGYVVARRIHLMLGRVFIFGFCGIYISLLRLFLCACDCILFLGHTRERAVVVPPAPVCEGRAEWARPAANKLSVVLIQ